MKYLLLIVVLLGAAPGTIGGWAGATDIAGTWKGAIDRPGNSYGPLNVTFIIKQEGDKLSGAYSDDIRKGGQKEITGTVKGDKVVISWELKPPAEIQKLGKPGLTVTFAGKIVSPTKMTGSIGKPFCDTECKWTVIKQKK